MRKKFKLFILNLLILLTLGLGKTYAQFILTEPEVRKVNETFAKLDSAYAQGRTLKIDLKNSRDSTKTYKDSSDYWKREANKLRRRRNNWRAIATGEAIYIALTSKKH